MELRAFWDVSLGGMDLMKADMVMASGHGCMYWMNLMEAGMVMIIIRNGCR